MYWSEWKNSNSIKKAAMDGSKSRKLISTKGHASDLTLDFDKRRLYWSEITTPAIWSSDLDGNDVRIIVKNDISSPIGLTLYKNYLYWSEETTGAIIRANINDGSGRKKIHQSNNITDLLVYQERHKGTNQCAISNGGCPHLCLAMPPEVPEKPVKYICACPTHYTYSEKECLPPKEFMIYSQKNLTVRLLPNPNGCLEAVLPIQGLKSIKAIDFDPVHNFLYWVGITGV